MRDWSASTKYEIRVSRDKTKLCRLHETVRGLYGRDLIVFSVYKVKQDNVQNLKLAFTRNTKRGFLNFPRRKQLQFYGEKFTYTYVSTKICTCRYTCVCSK